MIADAVVVTGAGRGIGRAVALALGSRGLFVVCLSKTDSAHRTATAVVDAGGRSQALTLDLAEYGTVSEAIGGVLRSHPDLRWGAVLAAGVTGPSGGLPVQDLAAWDETFRINVLGNVAVAQALLPALRRERFGRLVFFSGGGAAYAYPLFPAYSCTKTALVRVVENLHHDLEDDGDIGVVCLAPGAVATDLLAQVRSAGGEVRTETKVEETIAFVEQFLSRPAAALSGRFVHVRDNWEELLNDASPAPPPDHWTLRRVQ
jgi:NAD(P)-dependent dehydrogenase (short-subunit alcohol dehydrogenase family)